MVGVSTFVKVVVGLLLTLPFLAYAAGSLAASSAVAPEQPTPITVPADPRTVEKRSSEPGERSGRDRPPREEPRRGSLDQDDDEPEVVLPEPNTIDDDDSDDSDSRSGDDD